MDITDGRVDEVFSRAVLIPPGTQAPQIKDRIRQLLRTAASCRDPGLTRQDTEAEMACGMRFLQISRLPIGALQLQTERASGRIGSRGGGRRPRLSISC
jgi:hypothetical protein